MYNGPPLSRGAVRALVGGATELRPVLQVMDVKQIGAAGAPAAPAAERFRLIVSDGEHYQQAMLATQLNDLVKRGDVSKNCVVRVEECAPAGRAPRGCAARRAPQREGCARLARCARSP